MGWELMRDREHIAAHAVLGVCGAEEFGKGGGVILPVGRLKQTKNVSNRVKCSADTVERTWRSMDDMTSYGNSVEGGERAGHHRYI